MANNITSLYFLQNSYAQKLVRKETVNINYDQLIEVYYVLEENQKIKNGPYISYYPVRKSDYIKNHKIDSIRIKDMGNYYFNSKHGEWNSFYEPITKNGIVSCGPIKSSGEFIYNSKYGNWIEHDEQGKIQNSYYKIYIDTTVRKSNKIIYPSINYPEMAIENEISGDVIMGYWVFPDCSLDSIQFINKIGYGCEEVAFKTILKNYKDYPCNKEYHIDTIKFKLK